MATGKLTRIGRVIQKNCSSVATTKNAYKKVGSIAIPQSGLYLINGHWGWSSGDNIWSVARLTTNSTGELPGSIVRHQMASGGGMNTFWMGRLDASYGNINFEIYTADASYTTYQTYLTILCLAEGF